MLNSRLAIIVPGYAFLFFCILLFPEYWEFFEAGISFIEGYCIFCFYKMLKFHVGSKEATVQYIEQSNYTQPCCYSCQKKSPHCCYGFIDIALTQFCTVRPALFLLAAIIGLKGESSILAVLEILTIISLIVAMICLLRVYNFLIQHTTILAPTQKVLFIKGIIILLVIQNMLVASQQKTGIFDNGEHMEEE